MAHIDPGSAAALCKRSAETCRRALWDEQESPSCFPRSRLAAFFPVESSPLSVSPPCVSRLADSARTAVGLGLSDSRLIAANHTLLPSKENMFFTVSRSDHISSL